MTAAHRHRVLLIEDDADTRESTLALLEVATLLQQPTPDNARKLADALKNRDVSAKVKALLPAKPSYK